MCLTSARLTTVLQSRNIFFLSTSFLAQFFLYAMAVGVFVGGLLFARSFWSRVSKGVLFMSMALSKTLDSKLGGVTINGANAFYV